MEIDCQRVNIMKLKLLLKMTYAGFLLALPLSIVLLSGNSAFVRNMQGVFADSVKNGDILTINTVDGKQWVKAGRGIVITVAVNNTTEKTLSSVSIGDSPNYKFSVINDKHEAIPFTRYGSWRYRSRKDEHQVSSLILNRIKPGEKIKSVNILLNQLFDMSIPGEYHITASTYMRIGSEDKIIESNTLPITVVDYNNGETTPEEAEYEQKWEEKQEKEKEQKKNKTEDDQ